jgi:hypothetical protein
MEERMMEKWWIWCLCIALAVTTTFAQTKEEQLAAWLKKFPQADTNKDGTLTVEEAKAFQNKQRREKRKKVTIPPTHADVVYTDPFVGLYSWRRIQGWG